MCFFRTAALFVTGLQCLFCLVFQPDRVVFGLAFFDFGVVCFNDPRLITGCTQGIAELPVMIGESAWFITPNAYDLLGSHVFWF